MATDVLLEVKLPSATPFTDDTTDRWAFHAGAGDVDVAGVETAIEAFYNTTLATYLSPALSRATGAVSSSYYDIAAHLSGTPHGAPINVDYWTLGSSGGDALPSQLAAVIDFHADLSALSEFSGATRPRARHRGRHYFGPLMSSAITNGNSGAGYQAKLYGGLTSALQTAYANFLTAVGLLVGTEWCVWSRKDAALHPIVGGWVDETPHVQRRVQDPAGIKHTWT